MKIRQTYRYLLLASFMHMLGISQDNEKKQDNDNFNDYAFMVPIESYETLLKEGHQEVVIYKKLGNANYLSAKYDVAAFWYEKLMQLKEDEIEPDYLFRFAQSLKSIKQYEASDQWMEKFNKAKTEDDRARLYAKDKAYLKDIIVPSERYTIENLSTINSKQSDFAPSYFLKGMVFSTTRDLESEVKYNDFPYSNLYQTQILVNGKNAKLTKFTEALNTMANESSTTFSQDGRTVYFTRNNFKNNKFKRDKKGISRLKIYKATFAAGKWGNVLELPFNSNSFSVAHPSLNSAGTKLYFSSDMPGGKGASDIYYIDILDDGSFGTPQNLGAPINTSGKETFPFIADSGTLYFSSDGHPGIGGLDLFKVDMGLQGTVVNLGSPINSPEDDFSIIMDSLEVSGFFASNRKGGKGSDDIYALKQKDNDCFARIEGIAIDKDSDAPLAESSIIAYDHEGKKMAESLTDSVGAYVIRIPCQQKQYHLAGTKEGYEEGTLFMLTAPEEKYIRGTKLELEQSSKVATVGSDLVKILKLTPIYFDLNSSYIRNDAFAELDKVVDYMLRRPDIKIEVGSHTDSREEDKYNIWLSERRASRTVGYIVSKGIASDRISGKGYGETQLINNCKNGTPCSEKDHQLNRRSEFIVIER